MKAKAIARALQAYGIPVLSSTEGDEDMDGEVAVTESVCVQVPTFGSQLSVWLEMDDESFLSWPDRPARNMGAVVRDINDALTRTKCAA